MEAIGEFLANNVWFTLLISFITIISLPTSIVLFVKSKHIKQIKYDIRTNNIVHNKINKFVGLKVLFNNREIDSYSISKIVIYNSGNDVIHGTDISSIDKLRITSIDKEILGYNIIFSSKESNQFKLLSDKEKNSIVIDFEFIGKFEGVVISVIHTGLDSETLEIQGEIKGYGSPRYIGKAPKYVEFIDNIYDKINQLNCNKAIKVLVKVIIFVACLFSGFALFIYMIVNFEKFTLILIYVLIFSPVIKRVVKKQPKIMKKF